ncbi:TAT-binding protein-like protein 7, AAA ATPase [Malassezia psittaci]|uniref:TAT-binding protein-like protein 7, AAA ATPase n=1 Tax=Malassezia psittaci TaxID=1821823 RepID=A0AAF0JLD8_9BASI|nr:TAT-binding protein-like protein 7, AAA ATPase [Malassezia psittaci]
MVPSSARSSHTIAQPLPEHLAPLIKDAVDKAYTACRRMLPSKKAHSALEDAMWENDPTSPLYPRTPLDTGSPGAQLQRELFQQSFEKTRIYRPRMLLYGKPGMGQMTAAASLLHRLEGYTVQTLGITTLLGDSTQSAEAALVREFQEARRHKPSILLIPELDRWPSVMPDSVRASLGALLDNLQPSDPVLLLGVSHVPLWELSAEVRSWFGPMPSTRVAFGAPSSEARQGFIKEIVQQAIRPPTEFTDALPKRRRILPDLPKAAPRPAREPTQVELNQQIENDARILEHLKFRLGPVLAELRKKFKKFTRDVWEEYNLRELMEQFEYRREKGKVVIRLRYDRDDPAEQHEILSDSSSASDSHSKHAMPVQGGAHPTTDSMHGTDSDGDGDHIGDGIVSNSKKDDLGQSQTNTQQNAIQSLDGPHDIHASSVIDLTSDQRTLDSQRSNSDAVQNHEPMQIIASENIVEQPRADSQNQTISNPDDLDHHTSAVNTADTALGHDSMQASIPSHPPNPQESRIIQHDAMNSHTASAPDRDQHTYREHHSPESQNSNDLAKEQTVANPATDDTPTSRSDPNYIYRDFTIYTMNLDKMQKRLYYNRYLTCDAFMEDIQKIVSNAEEAHEVDTDRVFRARQMQNLATILLDQYMDTQFRLDCERMKERVLAREHAAQIEAEKRKEAEVYPRRPNGQRYSARQQGQLPGPDHLIDIGTVRIASKRARSQSCAATTSEANQESTQHDTEDTNATQPTEMQDSDGPSNDLTKRMRLESSEAATNTTAIDIDPSYESTTNASTMTSIEAQTDLIAHLTHATDGFNVEQLQQFRAACFDTIFLHRTQWDRTELFNSLHILANDLANEVNHVE